MGLNEENDDIKDFQDPLWLTMFYGHASWQRH